MTAREELERPLRPHLARVVSVGLGVLVVLGAVGLVVGLPAIGQPLTVGDHVGIVVLTLVICWFLYRQATVAALPDAEGLTVRNLFVTRRLVWEEIVSVRFGPDRPWGYLDLDDGESVPVMALQQADGERGRLLARRLATLVALHEAEDR